MLFHLALLIHSGPAIRALAVGTVAVVTILGAGAGQAAPDAQLWQRWLAHDPQSSAMVDHGAWSRLLEDYVEADGGGINRFDYGAVSAEDRARLRVYLERLARTPVALLGRPEQLAYWINLYNALTVDLVIAHFPVASILDIGPGSILKFNKSCDDALSLEVGNRKVAEGEAVKVGDRFGLWITAMSLPDERFWAVNPNSPCVRVK